MRNISLKVIILSILLCMLFGIPVFADMATPSDADKAFEIEITQDISGEENEDIDGTPVNLSAGWVMENGKWYYYDINGNGVTGWRKSGNTWYYCLDGEMLTDTITPDGYYVDADGFAQDYPGNLSSSSSDSSYSGPGGWVEIDGKWYYHDSNGNGVTGWRISGDTWYYCLDGEMLTDTITPDGYYVDANGFAQDYPGNLSSSSYDSGYSGPGGWVEIDGKWYYHDSNGNGVTGWRISGDNWYYCLDGEMLTDTITPDGYYVDSTGVLQYFVGIPDDQSNSESTSDSNSSSSGGSKKSSSGGGGGGGGGSSSKSIATGSNSTTGGPSAGYSTEGITLLDGSWEALEDGQMKFVNTDGIDAKSQWIFINDNFYFADSNGIMVIGWQMIDNNWYYFDLTTGIMLHDTITPDGYIVGSDGIWIQ